MNEAAPKDVEKLEAGKIESDSNFIRWTVSGAAMDAQHIDLPLDVSPGKCYLLPPHYLIWAIEPTCFAQILAARPGKFFGQAIPPANPMSVQDGIATIDVDGTIMPRTGLGTMFGGTATDTLLDSVEQAAADPDVRAILFNIDSPGGVSAGIADLGDSIHAARQQKPVVSHINSMGASAAYWIASQSDAIYANQDAYVGSIGVRSMFYDTSALFEKMGVKAIPIDTGEFKSAGAPGTPLTESQQEYLQGLVDNTFVNFKGAVARGRGLSAEAVDALSDGKVFTAKDAQAKGLITDIQRFDQTRAQLVESLKPSRSVRKMTAEVKAPASFEELKKGLPKAAASDSQFLCEMQEVNATLDEAKDEWIERQEKALADAQTFISTQKDANDKLKSEKEALEAGQAQAGSQGVDPGQVAEGDKNTAKGDVNPAEEFKAMVDELVAKGMDLRQATHRVIKMHPQLHEAFLDSCPAGRSERLG